MPNDTSYYNSDAAHRTIHPNKDGLPLVSEGLNSVRVYSFEVEFDLPHIVKSDNKGTGGDNFLTLAAKQVGNTGMSVEDIEVYRVNDKVFYPGRPTQDEVMITFDNLYIGDVSNALWDWFKKIYNPLTGQIMQGQNTSGFKAQQVRIHQLDAQGNPKNTTRLFGVYPRAWKNAEFNYSNNQFHTVEVTFRYDFIDHGKSNQPSTVATTLGR